MEACRICVEPCRACGMDPHDPKCGVCGGLHRSLSKHEAAPITAGAEGQYVTCPRCGRTVGGQVADRVKMYVELPLLNLGLLGEE